MEGTGEDGYVYYTGSDVLPTITGVYGIISGTSTMVNLSADDYNVEYTSGSNTTVGTHSFKIVLKSSSNYTFPEQLQRTVTIFTIILERIL